VFDSKQLKPRKWFEEWRTPGDFRRAADRGIGTFFVADVTPPHYLRDAYLAGAFACIWRDARGPCEVRLGPKPEESPDAQLKAGEQCLDVEITMALGRPMFKEWRELRAKTERGEIVFAKSLEQRQATAREAIPRVVNPHSPDDAAI
jgi:hypothetical protein